jgi:hypothetical protein
MLEQGTLLRLVPAALHGTSSKQMPAAPQKRREANRVREEPINTSSFPLIFYDLPV